ncbi:MAG: hypothetical protein OEZ10_04225 [Gammaproteobacteria bacterium]|nr:hypothetical protein [Gammaproteobacteria bacterium]
MSAAILRYQHYKPLFVITLLLSLGFWGSLLGYLWFQLPQWLAQYTPLEARVRDTLLPPLVFATLVVTWLVHALYRIRRLSKLRGFAVALTEKQQPDLFARLHKACDRLNIDDVPTAYICGHEQLLESVRVFGRYHLALDGDIIAALTERQGAIEFHMGQQLAKLTDPYRSWRFFLAPALVLPLLGTAWRRAQTYHYDRAGLGACKNKVDAAFGLAVEVTRSERWKSVNIPEFAKQGLEGAHFWMSLNELVSTEPWAAKRMAHLRALATSSDTFLPRRHILAWLLIAPVPYIRLGRPVGLLHLAWLALWLVPVLHWLQLSLPHISLAQWQPVPTSSIAPTPPAVTETVTEPSTENTEATPKSSGANPYKNLDTDLETLGALARGKASKTNPIPCEAGELGAIKLHYPTKRYVYNCDEPVVYSRVDQGEFEPGKSAHIRRYNWKELRMVDGSDNKNIMK